MARTGRRIAATIGAAALAAGVAVTTVPGGTVSAAPNDPEATVFISEFHYDNTGTDAGEAVEIFGPAGTDLTGWRVVRYNGANGLVYITPAESTGLPAAIPNLGGGYGVAVVTYPANGIQNGAPDALALVDGTNAVREFISYEGTFTAVDGPAAGLASVDIGVAQGGGGAVGNSLKRAGTGTCPRLLPFQGESPNTFNAIAPINPTGGCPPPAPALRLIHDVQGSGLSTPLAGTAVTIEGIVVGDHEGPAPLLRGFFVQEEDADADANPATSEGIFVFNGNANSVAIGDKVRISGTAGEFGGNTQLSNATITVLASGGPLPAAATVTFPVTAVSDIESFEGMRAALPQTLVISEYFNYDRFGEIVVALPAPGETRAFSPTALFAPDSPEAAARADLNRRSRITIDDGITAQNPSNVVHPITRDLFTLTNAFRGGDTVSGLAGPIFEAFGLYRVLPYGDLDGNGTSDGYATYDRTVAPATPDPVGGDLRVASLNTLNYFLTLDTADTCGPSQTEDCRGADDAGEFARQRPKLLNVIAGLDADVVGLIELENTPGVEALADIVDGLNERLGAGTYDYVVAGSNGVVGPDTIKVGVIYRPGRVTPLGGPAVLDTMAFLDPNNTGEDRNRAAVAQTFRDDLNGEVFSVVVNHFKSKGSACNEAGETTLAGNCDVTRTRTAAVLADWLATSPTGVADDDWLILGDLNAYDHEAPIATLEAAGYTDLAGLYVGEYAYSFTFDGQVGYLDYALANPSMLAQVTGATEWHINSDEPDLIDYDTTFKSPYQDTLFDPTTPFRASDHDAVLVGLALDSGVTFAASPDTLWAPNHKLRAIELSADDGRGTVFAVDALAGTSSEADSGLNEGDQPDDIVITDGSLQLRAERFALAGRTYTVDVVASGGGQVVFGSVVVTVPHDQRRSA